MPNLFRVLGKAPAALEGYLNFGSALGRRQPQRQGPRANRARCRREQPVRLLLERAHVPRRQGRTHRKGNRRRPLTPPRRPIRLDAILKLARDIVVQRGEVSDADLKQARASGLTDGEIVENVANVVVNILTNYVNHVARTVVDFPEVKPGNGQGSR